MAAEWGKGGGMLRDHGNKMACEPRPLRRRRARV